MYIFHEILVYSLKKSFQLKKENVKRDEGVGQRLAELKLIRSLLYYLNLASKRFVEIEEAGILLQILFR